MTAKIKICGLTRKEEVENIDSKGDIESIKEDKHENVESKNDEELEEKKNTQSEQSRFCRFCLILSKKQAMPYDFGSKGNHGMPKS